MTLVLTTLAKPKIDNINLVPPIHAAPDFDHEVLSPLQAAQDKHKSDCEATGGTLTGFDCVLPPPPPPVVYEAPEPVYVATADSLFGSIGYSLGWGNCVNESGVNNPHWGNPINWPITSTQPWIGASALFYFNHVAVVTGFWSNGDIEVRQQNSPGAPHRYSRSIIRGFR